MCKVLMGNHQEKVNYLKNHFINYGFEEFSDYCTNILSAYFFKKLKVDNANFLKIDDDFVATSGTLIYKKIMGLESLKNIYKDFSNGINHIRENAKGNYCIVIKKGSSLYIVTDTNAIHNIYYYNTNNEWMISNTFYHLAKVIDDSSINQLEWLEYSFQNAIIGNKTPFKNIFKLMGDEFIKIDLTNNKFNICVNDNVSNKNKEKITPNYFAKELEENTKIIAENFRNITVSMTGGVDARIIMSALLKNGVKPQIVYGVGDSPLTNTKNRDLEINKIYSDLFSLNFHKMNWKTNEPVDEYWEYALEKYGELFTVYSGNRNIYQEFENKIDFDYITFGYFGELMRNVDWIDSINSDYFTIDQFVDLYLNKNIIINKEHKEKLYKNILNKFIQICIDEKIDVEKIHKDDFTKIHLHYRKRADVVMCNFMSVFSYTTIILSEQDLIEPILNMKYDEKVNAKYMLKVMEKLYPEILDVPFFSHCSNYLLDREKLELKPLSQNSLSIKKIKSILKGSKYENVVRKWYYYISNNKENKKYLELKKWVGSYLKDNDDLLIDIKVFYGHIGCLVKYSQLVYMNNKLLNKERCIRND